MNNNGWFNRRTGRFEIRWKPTTFMGVRYRSRLEARWALFFHLLGIGAMYEPRSLIRRGWLPDFEISDFDYFTVEVKPIQLTDTSRIGQGSIFEKAIRRQKPNERVALLGLGPFVIYGDEVAVGYEWSWDNYTTTPLILFRGIDSNFNGISTWDEMQDDFDDDLAEPIRSNLVMPLWNKTAKHFLGKRIGALPTDHFVPDLMADVL